MQNVASTNQGDAELASRYKYFRELVHEFNFKEEKLRTLLTKKDELVK